MAASCPRRVLPIQGSPSWLSPRVRLIISWHKATQSSLRITGISKHRRCAATYLRQTPGATVCLAFRCSNSMQSNPKIEHIHVSVYTVPTETPESDGTFQWDKTSLVLVEALAGGKTGLGFSYADKSTAELIDASLAPKLIGQDALAIGAAWRTAVDQIRNLGRPGISSMAIAALDNALWDLKGKLLDVPVACLLGLTRTEIMAYGSGGFTSYSDSELRKQLGGWAAAGFRAVKMKIGRDAAADLERVRVAREAIGSEVQLFVDANGAYTRKQALYQAHRFREQNVTWFEE